jgi:hypothetical protein
MQAGERSHTLVEDWLVPFLVVTIALVLSWLIVVVAVLPLQRDAGFDLEGETALLFLPHGVRVLAAWFFGWRSVLFLCPGTAIAYFMAVSDYGFALRDLGALIVGSSCGAIAFAALARVGLDFRFRAEYRPRWRDIMLAGAVASVINALGTNLVLGYPIDNMAAYLVGDVTGLFVALFALMLAFRWIRNGKSRV